MHFKSVVAQIPQSCMLCHKAWVSNTGEDMDVDKCIVAGGHSKYSSSRKFFRKFGGSDHPPRCFASKLRWNGAETYSHLHGTQSCG
ncbi:hypothetical protein TNCV_3090921 [Trichonephila clavipes]|uniref:Uncharacterized protein n=1 Tax=Trichonephila clavipes TaxID=2585209 RepID=A0A8X7BH05_TRICX|nr:hypothetical protein TNCV_3090921 [Trichonephila clavipes]